MVLFDMPQPELELYRPDVAEPADFAEFWRKQLADAAAHSLEATFTPAVSVLRHADVFDVSFRGYGGDAIRGWLQVPHRLATHPATIVEFIGYGGGRGLPHEWLSYSTAGHVHFVMDSRGQGGNWRGSDTADGHDEGLPGAGGFLTRGTSVEGVASLGIENEVSHARVLRGEWHSQRGAFRAINDLVDTFRGGEKFLQLGQ